ncbi:MAG TPA: HAMP domain-containing sensor histidine kinase [Acidimicrobiia bacterium]|nr:HAMP domain-containing sensor histidine kinase [Acidimicrobiia bacterium]
MGNVARSRSTFRRRTIVVSVGFALFVLFLVAGLAFANSISVTRVTNNARSLHWTNAAVGTSALIRAGLVQAVTFAELEGTGVVTSEDFEFAMEQVDGADSELEDLLATGTAHESHAALARFFAYVADTVDLLHSGDVAAAKEQVITDVETSYQDLVSALDAEQAAIQSAIEENSEAGRTLNAWVVFILTLAVPGSAVVAYFVIARRQVRALQERSRVEIEAERTVSRAKDAFIAGLSHELRTPLTSIYGFAELLTDGDVKGVEASRETARIIANEAAEMTRMVDDLLAASRLESTGIEIEMTPTALQEVVEGAVNPFQRAGLEIDREPTSVTINTDGARLRQVLVNLISNAVRHGGPKMGLVVSLGPSTAEIEVWDNGSGVPEDRVERLFQRFVHDGAASLLTGSIGLGLAVASRLTDLLGGELQYQRYSGRTYFTLTLPLSAESEEESRDDEESVASMIKALST